MSDRGYDAHIVIIITNDSRGSGHHVTRVVNMRRVDTRSLTRPRL